MKNKTYKPGTKVVALEPIDVYRSTSSGEFYSTEPINKEFIIVKENAKSYQVAYNRIYKVHVNLSTGRILKEDMHKLKQFTS